MSKLQELIQTLCPEGVQYKVLGELCNILDYQRKPVSKSNRKFGIYPYYGANGIQDYVDDYLFDGTFLLVGEDGSVINKDNSPVINWADGKIWVNNHAHILSEKSEIMLLRFLYFALSVIDISAIVRGTPPKLNQENLRNIKIPVPPLAVQEEIVRILDLFTNLVAELQAELQARQKQYEHYRNKLLTFEKDAEGMEWKRLPDICENLDRRRKPVTASNRTFGPYPYYGASGIVDYVSSYIFDGNYLLISEDGANLLARNTPIAFSISGKNWVNNHAHVLKFQNMFTQKYIEYYINMIDVSQYVSGGAQPKLNQENLNKILIPIPPLPEQQRIVSILDKFETLVTDLSQGLPAEIAAVQEQYEYYRNKLLSFPKNKVSA